MWSQVRYAKAIRGRLKSGLEKQVRQATPAETRNSVGIT